MAHCSLSPSLLPFLPSLSLSLTHATGQCGVGHTSDVLRPAPVHLAGKRLQHISCGSTHSAALTEEGEVYIWGSRVDGKLGFEAAQDQLVPRRLEFFKEPVRTILSPCVLHS
jgi:hypothetical protein